MGICREIQFLNAAFGGTLYQDLPSELPSNLEHHQGVKKLSPFLQAMACAPEGLVEAVYMPEKKFVWGVQWHPEFAYQVDDDSLKILQAFVNAAKV